jgi:hypothetical protein
MSLHIPPGSGGPERWQIPGGDDCPESWRTFRIAIGSWPLTLRLCLLLVVCQVPMIVYLVLHK